MSIRSLITFVVALQISFLLAQPSPAPLSAAAQKVKDRVSRIGVGNKLTVWINAEEYHGSLQSIDPQTFSLYEVDLNTTETIPYGQVKKVAANYSGKSIKGRHMSYRKQWLGWAIGIGALTALCLVAAAELGKS